MLVKDKTQGVMAILVNNYTTHLYICANNTKKIICKVIFLAVLNTFLALSVLLSSLL